MARKKEAEFNRDEWTPERWQAFELGLRRMPNCRPTGLRPKRTRTPEQRSEARLRTTPGKPVKTRQEDRIDEMLAEGELPIYSTCMIVARRKEIARRHAHRKMRRAARQAQRR